MWIWDRVSKIEDWNRYVHEQVMKFTTAISQLQLSRDAQHGEIERLKQEVHVLINAHNSMLKVPDATCAVCGREMMAMEVMRVEGKNEYRCIDCGSGAED